MKLTLIKCTEYTETTNTTKYKCVDNYAGRAILKNVNLVNMSKPQGHNILLHYIYFYYTSISDIFYVSTYINKLFY